MVGSMVANPWIDLRHYTSSPNWGMGDLSIHTLSERGQGVWNHNYGDLDWNKNWRGKPLTLLFPFLLFHSINIKGLNACYN